MKRNEKKKQWKFKPRKLLLIVVTYPRECDDNMPFKI